MKLWVTVAFLASAVVTVVFPTAAGATCTTAVGMKNAVQQCERGPGLATSSTSSGPAPVYVFFAVCRSRVNGLCVDSVRCETVGGELGVLREVFVDGEAASRWCVAEEEAVGAGVVTPGGVLRAMRRLEWPASELVVQPPDGVTLVNFDTNFFTPDTGPVTRTVRLLGQVVRIEARPSEFVWSFGDGEVVRTSDPGAAYPDLRVTHAYRRTGVVEVGLATVYRGRFRVGGGAWQDVVGSVTVASASESLRVIEATPRLVGY